jgi:hypothetical protein
MMGRRAVLRRRNHNIWSSRLCPGGGDIHGQPLPPVAAL